MRFRSTLVLLVIFLGLLGYIYFYETKHPPKPNAEEEKPKLYASLQADQIDDIRLKSSSGDTAEVRKASGKWELVEPAPPAKADDTEIGGLTSNLATLEVDRVVEEQPKDLAQYGLAKPRIEVSFKAAGAKDFRTLQIGDKTATGGDLYAKQPQEARVFLIRGYLESTFDKKPFDLRDKTVLAFDRDKVTGVEIEGKDRAIALVKEGDTWKLTKPVAAKADFSAVEGFIGQIQNAKMQSIASSAGDDMAKYGLDKPAYRVALLAGSARAELDTGKTDDGGKFYAKDAARSIVFTVEPSLVDELKKDAATYRNKDLFEFRAFSASKVQIQRGGTTLVFSREKDKWKQTAPSAKDLDNTKVDDLLTKFADLRAKDFADDASKKLAAYGLDKPALTFSVWFDEGKRQETVTFGKKEGDIVYARRGEDPSAAKIDAKTFEEAEKKIELK